MTRSDALGYKDQVRRTANSKRASLDHEDKIQRNSGRDSERWAAIDTERLRYKDQMHPSDQPQKDREQVAHRPAAIDIERLQYKDGMHPSNRIAGGGDPPAS